MDGVLAEDARTSKTLFGGSARVFKEGGHTQDLANSPRRVGSKRSDEICHTLHGEKDPKGGPRGPVPSPQSTVKRLLGLARAAFRGRGDTLERASRSVAAATRRRTIFQAVTFP